MCTGLGSRRVVKPFLTLRSGAVVPRMYAVRWNLMWLAWLWSAAQLCCTQYDRKFECDTEWKCVVLYHRFSLVSTGTRWSASPCIYGSLAGRPRLFTICFGLSTTSNTTRTPRASSCIVMHLVLSLRFFRLLWLNSPPSLDRAMACTLCAYVYNDGVAKKLCLALRSRAVLVRKCALSQKLICSGMVWYCSVSG